MTTRDVAAILHEIQTLLDLHGEDEFRSKAYGRAARALETSGDVDLADVVARGEVGRLPGIGKGLAPEVVEIVTSGTSSQLEELRNATPPGLLQMLTIRGLGAKKVRAIHLGLGITTLAALEEACRGGVLAKLPGFGPKSQENVLAAIEELKSNVGRMRIDLADGVATVVADLVQSFDAVGRIEVAGRLRRGSEILDRIAFVVEAEPEALERDLRSSPLFENVALRDALVECRGPEGARLLFVCTTPEQFAINLFRATGSRDHVMMVEIALEQEGRELTAEGLRKGDVARVVEGEREIYDAAGLAFVPPELREGIDEVRRAIDGTLPTVLELSSFRGMIHMHSTWSDGRHSISELADHVRALGYQYMLVTDHSKAAFYANGLDEKRLEQQGVEIDELNNRLEGSFRVLKGIECDILADGSLDLADEALSRLDAVIISVHSRFDLDRAAQTDRINRALENDYTTILGHPTGRLLLGRKGYEIDHHAVIDAAKRLGKGIEINANPRRLDLSWRMVRYAVSAGVPIAISPDAHAIAHFDYMRFGLTMARKGGLTLELAINAMSAEEVRALGRNRHS